MNKEIIFSAKEYKEKYNDLLQSYLIEYEDYEEIDFINIEIQRYTDFITDLEQLEVTLNYLTDLGSDIDAVISESQLYTFHYIDFLDCFDYKKRDRSILSFTKIIDFLEIKKLNPRNENNLNWNGTQIEFIELVKALIENGNIKGTQTETIKSLSNIFNFKINNENKTINDIKNRNNGSETLFLDKLKKTLFDYITLENKK
jgi:hypothetical protein